MPSILNATTTNGLVTSADNSGSLQLQTNNGTTAVTIDTSQNVGIGKTPSTGRNLEIYTATAPVNIVLQNSSTGTGGTDGFLLEMGTTDALVVNYEAGAMRFFTSASERMRITSGGDVIVNATASVGSGKFIASNSTGFCSTMNSIGNNADYIQFWNGSQVGSITRVGGTNVAYNTSSDYRLKENVAPMTGALAKVQQLKPCNWTWKIDGSDGQGFIAHELQEVCPDAVNGTKDAVDQEGKPVYQGVDTSFLVATLTAAIQELKAELDATKAEVQALKGVA